MVCVAAFIILVVLSIFSAKYRKPLKKAWGCVGKKVTLQKCETNFKDDVKNTMLAKVIVKKPQLVKPLGIAIEVAAVLIVILTVWSLLTVVKSGLALYVYGTCSVSNPSSCSLDASESCSIDGKQLGFFESIGKFKLHEYVGNWFNEFGEVIMAVPARLKQWEASEYISSDANYYRYTEGNPIALDILDPGCNVCKKSYAKQLESGFFDKYNVALLAYPIGDDDGGYKFKNSLLLTRYIEAVRDFKLESELAPEWLIINKLFTEYNEKGVEYQEAFNASYSAEQAEELLQVWLGEFGYSDEAIEKIAKYAKSDEVRERIERNKDIVENQVKTKKIPTMIYDGKRHSGMFEDK